jgi:hypothetical protein
MMTANVLAHRVLKATQFTSRPTAHRRCHVPSPPARTTTVTRSTNPPTRAMISCGMSAWRSGDRKNIPV